MPSIPFAESAPLTFVNEFSSLIFDQATIVPPDPLIKASADILVASSIFK